MQLQLRNYPLVIAVLVGVLTSGVYLFAQTPSWSGPTAIAPGGNVEPPINVGLSRQVKNGPLNIQMVPGSTGYKSSLTLSNWTTTAGYAIDTNGPLASNGVLTTFFTGTGLIKFFSVPSMASTAPLKQPLCIDKNTKLVQVCPPTTTVTLAPVTASLSLSPNTLSNPGSVSVILSSQNASKCIPAHGPLAFNFSQGETSGSWSIPNVSPLTTFSVVCTNSDGRAAVAVAKVAQGAPTGNPPIISLLASEDGSANSYVDAVSIDPNNLDKIVHLRRIISGGAPTSCVTWTAVSGVVTGQDGQWPGTSAAPANQNIAMGTTNYQVDIKPATVTPTNNSGFRKYYLQCSNAFGTDTEQVTVYLDY